MPQSLSQVLVHLVFSTKNRTPVLDALIAPRLHAYLATVCRDHGCETLIVGGHVDHVHLVLRLDRTISQSTLLETIKKASSHWLKAQGEDYVAFYWQRGYGAFSLSPSHLDAAVRYVRTQATHHRAVTFQDEFRRLAKYTVWNATSGTCGIERGTRAGKWLRRPSRAGPVSHPFLGRCPRLD